jgi:peptidoglycan/LPS O-acetylase OafA/YrhL
MPATKTSIAVPKKAATRFYRPELDALRFFAFLAVLVHHGPSSGGVSGLVSGIGGFGLSMFFLLSAYLITELLLREREQTGSIAWNLFFVRRALRIWPLYYAALTVGFFVAQIPPHRFWISRPGIAGMSFFVANWFRLSGQLGPLVAPLWSISVEEQFYIIWPPVIRAGGKRFALIAAAFFIASAVVWLWIFSGRGWKLWYDTPVEFLFFAGGAIIACATHGKRTDAMAGLTRSGLLIAGLLCLALVSWGGGIGTDNVQGLTTARLYLGYSGAVAGCVMIFLATLGVSNVPKPLIYLGKISYGLYVFHAGLLALSRWVAAELKAPSSSIWYVLIVDAVALLLCVLAAHFSYKYFERPFLRLKERFEVVHSRPA